MGLLAIDIETASPFEEPPPGENSTEYFEWIATALAYRQKPQEEIEIEVLFRNGGWDIEYTADMLDRVLQWVNSRESDQIITYNGAWFDLKHIGTWGEMVEEKGIRSNTYRNLIDLFSNHIDLAPAAADQYSEKLWDDQDILPDWKVYQLENIDNESIWYNNYDFNEAYFEGLGISEKFVKGEHVGQALGEKYVEGVVNGLEDTKTHNQLENLLRDYAKSDVADLFQLYDSLGGSDLYDQYNYPLDTVISN